MTTTVIRDATVVTVNKTNEILEHSSIVIEGNRIKAVGHTGDATGERNADVTIDASGMVALPGLINGHLHPITALYKGTMVGLGFEKTAGEDSALAFRATPEIMLAASRLAAAETLLSGTTLANVATDAMTFEVARQAAEAFGRMGMRALVQTAVADVFGPSDLSADVQLAEAEKLLREYHHKFNDRIRVSLGPVGDLTTSPKTMRHLAELAESEDLIMHMHVFPHWPSGMFTLLFRGHFPLGFLESGGLLNKRLVAVHFLAAKSEDLRTLAKAGASVVHCPSVWMNAGIRPKRWLPITELYHAGVNIVLGTDSLGGWIEGSDMFTEMRNCALMSSFLYGAGSLKPTDILRMATINGAQALGQEEELGSLEAGKLADIILLEFDRVSTQPSIDVPAMIVYGSSGRDVRTVVIDGQAVVRDRVILTVNEREIQSQAVVARADLYRGCGWTLAAERAIPPTTSWLERYPNKQLARWAGRWTRMKRALGG